MMLTRFAGAFMMFDDGSKNVWVVLWKDVC